MKIYPEYEKLAVTAKQRLEKACRIIALVVAFTSVFAFFIKVLFF